MSTNDELLDHVRQRLHLLAWIGTPGDIDLCPGNWRWVYCLILPAERSSEKR